MNGEMVEKNWFWALYFGDGPNEWSNGLFDQIVSINVCVWLGTI